MYNSLIFNFKSKVQLGVFLGFTFCLISISLFGQQSEEAIGYRKYVNREAFNLAIEHFPDLQISQAAYDKETNARAPRVKIKKTILPVVFNVVYNSAKQKISEEQIYAQIEALNRDFALENRTESIRAEIEEGFVNVKAKKLDIQFCLPKNNKDKKFGIKYYHTEAKDLSLEDVIIRSSSFDFSSFPVENYINIWILDFENDITGFAQRPGGPARTDGIFIDYKFFGTGQDVHERFNEGKTLTHLMGNYLGLKDLWGERPCIDDDIDDTPVHSGPNHGCPSYKHISTCSTDNNVEMTMNFMDNTDDACMYMFTVGQMLKMHATIIEGGIRHSLLSTKTKCSNGKSKEEDFEFANPIYTTETKIYPNPAQDIVNINIQSGSQGHTYIAIYDALGKMVFSKDFSTISGEHIEQINSQNWARGIYFIHIEVNDHSTVDRVVLTNE